MFDTRAIDVDRTLGAVLLAPAAPPAPPVRPGGELFGPRTPASSTLRRLREPPQLDSVVPPDARPAGRKNNGGVIVARRAALTALIAAAVVVLAAGPGFADGGGESDKAGDLVRQAIAHIVHDPKDTMAAVEKIDDAENAGDKEGVDMNLVAQAADALAQGDFHGARSLLERSIGARPHVSGDDPLPIGQIRPLATGAETGIDVVTDPLAPRRGLSGGDWVALSGLVGLGALGVYLARRFRPQHTPKAA